MPSSSASARTRSPDDMRAMPASRSAFWRSSVALVVTAREIPALSLSSETCMATIPPSSRPISQIHARPRRRPSTNRVSGSARMRSKTPVVPRRTAAPAAGAGRSGPETRRGRAGAGRDRSRDRAWRVRVAVCGI